MKPIKLENYLLVERCGICNGRGYETTRSTPMETYEDKECFSCLGLGINLTTIKSKIVDKIKKETLAKVSVEEMRAFRKYTKNKYDSFTEMDMLNDFLEFRKKNVGDKNS